MTTLKNTSNCPLAEHIVVLKEINMASNAAGAHGFQRVDSLEVVTKVIDEGNVVG